MRVRRTTGGFGRASAPPDFGGGPAERARFLTVGAMAEEPPQAEAAPDIEMSYLDYCEVTVEALLALRPDVVLSALVNPEFDCLDLAERLSNAGFRGKYRAVAVTVPDPGLVRREITERFPGLDFDILILEDRG